VITQCCIHELYLQGKPVQPVVDLAKGFERRKCNHREAIPGDACLKDVVGEFDLPQCSTNPVSNCAGETNKHRYVVATQSQSLRSSLRDIPAVPIVHINRSVMILEPPSVTTLEAKTKVSQMPRARNFFSLTTFTKADEAALRPDDSELAKLSTSSVQQTELPRKKKRGPKGPNPLSVKKKKPAIPQPAQPKPESKPNSIGVKRKSGDEAPAGIGQASGGGHKRKRRRKIDTQTSPSHDAS
jgi:U3 small nucleolar RNA-associated protein 23